MVKPRQLINTTDEVQYQDGSIVSKELVKGNAGGVTLFAFDKGQGLSEYTVPFDVLVYVLDGQDQITIDGEVFNPRLVSSSSCLPINCILLKQRSGLR